MNMLHPKIKTLLALCFLATLNLSAEMTFDGVVTHPVELSALSHFGALFEQEPVIQGDRSKGTIELRDRKEDTKDGGSLAFTIEDGQVIAVRGNRARLHDAQFAWFGAFESLRSIKLDHNFDDKTTEEIEFDGSGLSALSSSNTLEVVRLAGGSFGDAGAQAAAQLPHLKELIIFHTQVTDAGIQHLQDHPSLEKLVLGPAYAEDGITNVSMAPLAAIPNLRDVTLNEMILTWEEGLEHLVAGNDHFERIDLARSAIPPKDLAKLREAMPETTIEHIGYSELIEQLDNGTLKFGGRLKKNIPAEMLSAMRAAAN